MGGCMGSFCMYLPLMFKPPVETLYYYAGGERIAMMRGGVFNYLLGDHLGSVVATVDRSGTLTSSSSYYPWGTTHPNSGASPTDYGFTGQMQEGDIYFYNARWYDPQLGRFMQADTLVPLQVQGTQAFDRYAYVNNSPIRFYDPNGNLTCEANMDCFVDGWVNGYTQRQIGNTCAVVAQAIGLSILSGDLVRQNDIQIIWPLTYIGIGVPVGLQVSGINTNYRNIEAIPIEGDREEIISHLLLDEPVVFTVAMPRGMVGHAATAIGYNSELNQLIIHDSGYGKVMYEDEWVAGWRHQIEARYPNSDIYESYSSFDDFQSGSNLFVQPYSFVVLRTTQQSGGLRFEIPFHGGGGNRLFSPFLEVR